MPKKCSYQNIQKALSVAIAEIQIHVVVERTVCIGVARYSPTAHCLAEGRSPRVELVECVDCAIAAYPCQDSSVIRSGPWWHFRLVSASRLWITDICWHHLA